MNYPKKVLMVSPEYFDVLYQINDHMNLENKVDKVLAVEQWSQLKSSYEQIGFDVIVAPGDERYPDMVFTANQLMTTPDITFLSTMRHAERRGEVEYLRKFLNLTASIQIESGFESMGDCLWDYEGERLFGGYGFRTDLSAYDEMKNHINNEICTLELVNSNFYHLDTCLSIVNETAAFYVPSAFNDSGIEKLKNNFDQLIEVDQSEATQFLACNAHCPDGQNIFIEKGAINLQAKAKSIGLKVTPIDTSEFLKSGGSIFCLKNQGWF